MTQNVINHIENILTHLQVFLPLANVHMVDYFTKNVYNKFIPQNIRSEVEENGYKESLFSIFNIYNNDPNSNLASLTEYITKCKSLTLKNCDDICLNLSTLEDCLKTHGSDELSSLKLSIFMSSKKSHEVEILSAIASAIRNITNTSHLIDIGDGKGYLSSMLAMHHKIPTLGVDASEINTNSSVERVRKLTKVWNSIVGNDSSKKITNKSTTAHLYKQITKFVDDNVDFEQLIKDIFLEKPTNIGLVGLHTCGNLATNSLRIYNANDCIKSICNVGCCYHFLTEAFEQSKEKISDNSNSNCTENIAITPNVGFPMSSYLKNKQFTLGRAARMIAAQSIDRVVDKHELPNVTIFYRALFEIILEKKCPNLPSEKRQVGRFRKIPSSFIEYVEKAFKKLNIADIDISEEEILALYAEYEGKMGELQIFYMIRAMLAPVIESLILLDRLLFLYELGYQKNSYLVQMFDPVLSPRCYGIVSFKDF